jgi:recombination protein RecA
MAIKKKTAAKVSKKAVSNKATKSSADLASAIATESKAAKPGKELIEWIPTGSTLLDKCFGGGYPVGKIVNLVGDNSSGKTLFCCELIASARRKFGNKLRFRYDDCEAGFSFDTEKMYGFEMIPTDKAGAPIHQASETIEDFDTNLNKEIAATKPGQYLIYIVDSLDALSSESEMKFVKESHKAAADDDGDDEGKDDKKKKGTYGMDKQKYLSRFFRTMANPIKNSNCLLVIVSQVRTRISMFPGPKYERCGGKALDFYAAIICWLAEAEKHFKLDRATGITVKARTSKNKVGLPFRECFVDVVFDYGFDNVASNLCYVSDARTPQGKLKKDKLFEFNGKKLSRRQMIAHVEENNLESELADRVCSEWEAIDQRVSSNDRKKRF